MTARKPRRTTLLPWLAIVVFAALVPSTGCTGRAQRDLYAAKLNSEVRVLEDQLYAADYENRVLRDQLERYRREVADAKIPTPSMIRPHDHPDSLHSGDSRSGRSRAVPPPIVDYHSDMPLVDMGHGLETEVPPREGEVFEAPMVDDGQTADINADDFDSNMFVDPGVPEDVEMLQTPQPNLLAPKADKKQDAKAAPKFDMPDFNTLPAPKDTPPKASKPRPSDNPGRLPAPGGPVPPGKRDLEVPPLIPGEMLPPDPNGGDGKPPGQIILPDSIQAGAVAPDRLEVHKTLSVGHYTDGKFDGAVIVITAVDGDGRPMEMDGFDIDAAMSMVVLDPTRESSEALVGRWDFTRQQVETMIRTRPVPGIHIPIEWKGDVPNSERIIVHVRLEGDDEAEMNAYGELRLSDAQTISDWTPRASNLR